MVGWRKKALRVEIQRRTQCQGKGALYSVCWIFLSVKHLYVSLFDLVVIFLTVIWYMSFILFTFYLITFKKPYRTLLTNALRLQTVFCKELTLPPSDLAHNAERVCVIPSVSDRQSASCIAVSPEGIVRYWPNIAYEGSSTEISAELRGDECASVVNFEVSSL